MTTLFSEKECDRNSAVDGTYDDLVHVHASVNPLQGVVQPVADIRETVAVLPLNGDVASRATLPERWRSGAHRSNLGQTRALHIT